MESWNLSQDDIDDLIFSMMKHKEFWAYVDESILQLVLTFWLNDNLIGTFNPSLMLQ